jgi:hypothetical protein
MQSTVDEPKSSSRGGTYKYFVRGQHEAASSDDYKVEHVRKQQLKPYDAFLKKFQYHDALNAALEVRFIACVDQVLQCHLLFSFLFRLVFDRFTVAPSGCGRVLARRAAAARLPARCSVKPRRGFSGAAASLFDQADYKSALYHAVAPSR